jgi:hypothetical protein
MGSKLDTLRANASLQNVALAARAQADSVKRDWLRFQEAARTQILTWDQQVQRDGLWRHFSDLDALATHLERLAGVSK